MINKLKSNKGITLIALVVTIVILIILATVSINMLISGGLLEETQNSKQIYELSEEKQKLELVKATALINGLGELTIDGYIDELIKEGITTEADVTDNGDGSKTIITDNGYKATITPTPDNKDLIIEVEEKVRDAVDSGEDEQPEEPDEPEVQLPLATSMKINKTAIDLAVGGTTTITATISPDDASKNVIWESSDENIVRVNNGTIEAVQEGNATITVKTTDGSNLTKTCTIETATLPNGWEASKVEVVKSADLPSVKVPLPKGFVASKATNENKTNTGLVIYEGEETVTDDNVENAKKTRNQFVWVPVSDPNTMYEVVNGKNTGKFYRYSATEATRISSYKEPIALSTDSNYGDISTSGLSFVKNVLKITGSTNDELMGNFEKMMQDEFDAMIASVIRYGGFFIGRYETGDLTWSYSDIQPAVIVKGNTLNGYNKWPDSYYGSKNILGETAKSKGMTTTLIWGCQWSATEAWLVSSGNKTIAQIYDSRSWGNHSDSIDDAAKDSGSRRATGYSEYWKANNIYDLAGNMEEWTMMGYRDNYASPRIKIGGRYDTTGDYGGVSGNTEWGPYQSSSAMMGARATLVI